MKILHINLLGRFRIVYEGQVLDSISTPRMQSLLAYLVLHAGIPLFRFHLAFTFWPNSSEAQALTNLRNLFHRLRNALPDAERYIKSDTLSIQWITGSAYRLDTQEFERLLASKETRREAIDLYVADLLPECYEDWIQPERERLQRLFREHCLALADALEMERGYPAALSYVERLATIEPLDEAVCLRQVRLHALMDNRALAIAAYQAFMQKTQEEFGITPGAAVQTLYQNILRTESAAAQPPKEQVPLVGRSKEWASTLSLWKQTYAGGAHMLLLSGEPGIGKTRFAEEVVEWAARQGILTAKAACYPAEASLPYAPVVTWLQMLPFSELAPAHLSELSRFLPDLRERNPDLPSPAVITEPWQGQRLFEALARAIVGDGTPRLLWLDDLHWCDTDTIAWLQFLIRFAPKSPLFILCGIRSDAVEWPSYVLDFINYHREVGCCSLMQLGPLDEAQTAQIAGHIGGSTLTGTQAETLYRETEGNPLFIVEFIHAREGPQAGQTRLGWSEAAMPGKVHAILEKRLRQLSPAAFDLACLAAIFGRQFHLESLEVTSHLASEALDEALDELLSRQIIKVCGSFYVFTHDKLRETVLQSMKTSRKRLLHRRVADRLVNEGPCCAKTWNAEIAYHYDEAGLPAKALDYYLRAARDMREAFSNQEALRYLLRAIELTNTPEYADGQAERAHLYETLGDVYVLLGRPTEAREAYLSAFSSDHSRAVGFLANLYRKLSTTYEAQRRFEDAHAALDQAEALFCRTGMTFDPSKHNAEEKSAWLMLQHARAYLYYWQGNIPEIGQVIGRMREVVESSSRAEERLDLLDLELLSALQKEKFSLSPQTVAVARQKYQLSVSAGSLHQVAHSQFQLGFALLWQGQARAAVEELAEGLRRGETIGDFMVQVRCRVYLSLAYRMLHEPTKVREITLRLLDDSKGFENPVTSVYHEVIQGNLAWLSWKDGDLESAVRYGLDAFETREKTKTLPPLQWTACWPLLASALGLRDLDLVARAAQAILSAEQQPMPEAISRLCAEGLKAAAANNGSVSEKVFFAAVEAAKQHGYL